MKMETQWSKIYKMKQNSSKKEVYSNTNVPKKIQKKKISYEQPNLIPKGTRKRRTKKIQT